MELEGSGFRAKSRNCGGGRGKVMRNRKDKERKEQRKLAAEIEVYHEKQKRAP